MPQQQDPGAHTPALNTPHQVQPHAAYTTWQALAVALLRIESVTAKQTAADKNIMHNAGHTWWYVCRAQSRSPIRCPPRHQTPHIYPPHTRRCTQCSEPGTKNTFHLVMTTSLQGEVHPSRCSGEICTVAHAMVKPMQLQQVYRQPQAQST